MNTLIKIFIVLMAMLFVAEASHFRFGTISWQPTTAPNIIKFSSNFAFRTTFFKSSKTDIKLGDSIQVGTLTYGAGSGLASNSVVLTVTDFDPVNDWFSGSYTVTKTYPLPASGVKSNYIAIFTDCCRISTLLNNKDGSWNITSLVQVENPTNANQVLNSSPVSGMLPIYNVVYGKNNYFDIKASDPNGDDLTFSFSTVYSMTQPPGMSITPAGRVYIKPAAIGLYSTQIYIIDSRGAYVVIDFILNSVSEPGVCIDSCSNSGASCTTNSQCSCPASVTNNVTNTCSVNANPPYFVTPTPADGTPLVVNVKSSGSFTLKCQSGGNAKTYIQTANVPAGMSQAKTTEALAETITYTFKPNVTDVGSYVMSAYCYDISGLTSTVRSYPIVVPKPKCGAGEEVSGVCKCPDGWDPKTNCFDCTAGHYGPNCNNSTKCVNGNSIDYINGNGLCTCFNGWTGEKCDTPISKTCSDLLNSVIASTTTATSYINPTFISLYVKDQTTVPIKYSVPYPLPNLDVYVLVDVNTQSTTVWSTIKSNMNNFVTAFKKFSENTQFGLGYFSDVSGTGFNFQPSLTIGSEIGNGILTYSPQSYLSTSTGNSLAAITEAASSPLGWSTNSFKTIIVLTDSDHTSTSAQITEFQNTLSKQSIMPIVIGFNNALLPLWRDTIASTGFGFVNESTTGADWITKASGSFNRSIQSIVFKSIEDADENVIDSVPATVSINSGKVTEGTANSILVKIPSSTDGLADSPTPRVSAVGWGYVDLRVNYNRKPVATPTGFSCNQNSKTTFSLSGTDKDSNVLKFSFVTLPVGGTVSVGTVNVTVDTPYAADTVFTFTTASKTVVSVSKFQFRANDGCVNSDPADITVTINRVNQNPECGLPVDLTSSTATPIKFTLSGSDFEDSVSKLYSTFVSFSLISPTYGYFKVGSNNITSTTQVPIGTEITFIQTNNVFDQTKVSFYYTVVDSGNLGSVGCPISITLTHTNVAPVATGTSPVSVIPYGKASISLNATDIDSDSVKFTITAVAPGAGAKFYDCGNTNVISVGKVYNNVPVVNGKADFSGSVCYNASSSNGIGYGSISYSATDIEGLTSLNTFTIKIDVVGNRTNNPPTVTPIPAFSVYQDTLNTVSQTITGIDNDPDESLIAVISTPPQNGRFLSSPTGSQVVTGKAPLAIYYQPNSGYEGSDSFKYYVYDTFGAPSDILTTNIVVNRINHAPQIKKETTFKGDSQTNKNAQTITWLVTDPENDPIKCSITEAPANVVLYDGDSLYQLKSNLTNFNNVKFFVDPSKTQPNPYTSFSSFFTVVCSDIPTYPYPGILSDSNRFTYLYTYVNTKPQTTSFDKSLNQDDQISFTFNGTDLESSVIKVSILSLPTNGKLLYNGNEIASANGATYSLSGFVYKPNKGMSNYDTNNLPLDKFSFVVVDSDGLSSDPATGVFNVAPRNPPIYTGLKTINVYQNTRYPLTITGVPGNGGVEVNLKVTGFTGREGSVLSVSHIMGTEKAIDTPIDTYPIDLVGSTTYYLAYMPPHNKYGDNFDTITIQLYDRDIYSGYITIIVNVIHVNQPPVITPISYVNSDNSSVENFFVDGDYTVNMKMDTKTTIKFDGSDVDEPVIPLQAILPSIPPLGTIKTLDGAVISGVNQNISKNIDGHYYITFEPAPGAGFARYATIPMVMKDEYGLYSEAAKVVINVNRENIPPFVTVEDQYQAYTFNVKDIVTLKGINASDPDSKTNNITLTLSIINSMNESTVPLTVASINVPSLNSTNSKCILDQKLSFITCNDTKDAIQRVVQGISVSYTVAGDYRLKVFVNDLGYNAPKEIRDSSFLTATNYVNMTIKNPGTTTNKSNKTILSVAIAAAGAAAAIIAAAVWKIVKKAAPPTDAFFGEGVWQGDGVSQNPLYTQSANSGVNPLYENANDA